MTRERAIKILQQQQAEFNEEFIDYGGINDAYRLAIEALKQERIVYCKDCRFAIPIENDDELYYECTNAEGLFRDVSPTSYCSAWIERHEVRVSEGSKEC